MWVGRLHAFWLLMLLIQVLFKNYSLSCCQHVLYFGEKWIFTIHVIALIATFVLSHLIDIFNALSFFCCIFSQKQTSHVQENFLNPLTLDQDGWLMCGNAVNASVSRREVKKRLYICCLFQRKWNKTNKKSSLWSCDVHNCMDLCSVLHSLVYKQMVFEQWNES